MKKYWLVVFLLLFGLYTGSQAAQDGKLEFEVNEELMNNLRTRIIKALKQERDGFVKDGMDMTVCVLDQLFEGCGRDVEQIDDVVVIGVKY